MQHTHTHTYTHTHTHTQYTQVCALVYRIFSEQTNKLNLFLAKKSNRISQKGSTAFFISFFVGIIILIKNNIDLNLFATEQFFLIVKIFSYSVVCLFPLVCVGGAGFFIKQKITIKN